MNGNWRCLNCVLAAQQLTGYRSMAGYHVPRIAYISALRLILWAEFRHPTQNSKAGTQILHKCFFCIPRKIPQRPNLNYFTGSSLAHAVYILHHKVFFFSHKYALSSINRRLLVKFTIKHTDHLLHPIICNNGMTALPINCSPKLLVFMTINVSRRSLRE